MAIAFARTVILYLFIIIGIRLMGKRQVGELEPSELVMALLIADLAAVPMQDFGIPLLSGIIPILTLLCLSTVFSVLSMKSVRLRALLCGKPTIVVDNGKLKQAEMRKTRFTLDELSEELRLQGVTDLEKVRYAILETGGQLTVLLKAEEMPLTAGQFGKIPKETGLPVTIISDGRLLEENLKLRGLDDKWLAAQLAHGHVKTVKQVFLLTVDQQNKVYFAAKELRG